MLNSLLVHLNPDDQGDAVIRGSVDLARRHEARIHGLAIAETRRILQNLTCESAAYALFEQEFESLQRVAESRESADLKLSRACYDAGVDCHVRRIQGHAVDLLALEAETHDLIVTGFPSPAAEDRDRDEVAAHVRDLIELPLRGAEPVLVLREPEWTVDRALLVYDGTPASRRAIESFLKQQLWPSAAVRLLAVGDTDAQAEERLRELTGSLVHRRGELETGCIRGPIRRVLVPYIKKWQADLVVLGATRQNPILRRLWGTTVTDVLRHCSSAVYVTG